MLNNIASSKRDHLEEFFRKKEFFSAEMHQPDLLLSVIVSEKDTWHKSISLFLQAKLAVLNVNYPLLIRNSDEVIDFSKDNSDRGFQVFSVDLTDLYYILHNDLLSAISQTIDEFGATRFQNNAGLSSRQFLELLSFYLSSTFIT